MLNFLMSVYSYNKINGCLHTCMSCLECNKDIIHHSTLTMQIRWFVLLNIVTRLLASRNEIARDYFIYKNVSSVVAFLCTNATNHFHFTKILNQEGISVAILYPEFEFSLETAMTVKNSRFGVFLDLHCPHWYCKFILTESSKLGTYNESYNWLLYGKSLNESVQMLNDDKFSITTDLLIATPDTIDNGYNLYDVYNHGKERGGKLNVTKFASWKNETGLNVTLVQEKYQRRANFHGMKLKVISVTKYRPNDMPVQDYLQDYSTRSLDTMSKFAYAILLEMGDIFNFTMEIVETNYWDQVVGDGVHLGMIGMLYRSEGDLGATPAIMSRERATMNQLIGPFWPFRSCFMFRTTTMKMNDEFIRPFTPESWAVSGLVVLLCTFVLSLAFKIEFFKDKLNAWNEAGLVTIGIMCQQGAMITPNYLSSRIVIIHLLIFSLLIYNYYSASVVSAQLNLPLDKMNDSLHELTKSSLTVAAEPVSYLTYGLTAFDYWEVKEFYAKRWQPLSEKARFMSLEEGFARVVKGGFAYHTDPNTGYPYIERLFSDKMICELTEVHLFKAQKMGMWGRRNSPFTKIAKIGLTKLANTGILSRQIKRWRSRKPVCFREAFIVQSVSIMTTAPALVILCVGILLSSLLYIIESVIARSQNITISNLGLRHTYKHRQAKHNEKKI